MLGLKALMSRARPSTSLSCSGEKASSVSCLLLLLVLLLLLLLLRVESLDSGVEELADLAKSSGVNRYDSCPSLNGTISAD